MTIIIAFCIGIDFYIPIYIFVNTRTHTLALPNLILDGNNGSKQKRRIVKC